MAGEYQAAILSMSGLVAHWPLSDAGAAMDDVSPNDLSGAYAGTLTKGIGAMLPALTSTGVLFAGGYATVPDGPLLDVNAHTFLAWVKPTTLKASAFLCNRFAQWGYAINKHHFVSDQGGVTPQANETLGELIVPESVFFLAGGYSGSGSQVWLNGTLSSTVASSGTLATGSNPLTIGSAAGVNTFEGVGQHFSLFNRILADEEVKDLYLLGIRGPADPTGFGIVTPWSRQILASNGLRKKITNPSGTRIYLGLGQPAVDTAGPVLEPFGDIKDLGTYTGAVHAKHTLQYGHKAVVVEEY